jgi:hypothetical protein
VRVVKKLEDANRAVLGGGDGRALSATVTLVKVPVEKDTNDTVLEYEAVLYDKDASVLQHFDTMLRALQVPITGFYKDPVAVLQKVLRHPGHYVPSIVKYFALRFTYVFLAECRAQRLLQAKLSWLRPEQVVILTHWYLNTRYASGSLFAPQFWYALVVERKTKAQLAHDCVAHLLLQYAGRYSKVDSWRKAYYHYLYARVLYVKGFPAPMVNRAIRDALRLSEAWVTVADPAQRSVAVKHCIQMKCNIGTLYWRRAVNDWSGQQELFASAQKMLTEAHELAVRFGTEPDEVARIRTILEKVVTASKA